MIEKPTVGVVSDNVDYLCHAVRKAEGHPVPIGFKNHSHEKIELDTHDALLIEAPWAYDIVSCAVNTDIPILAIGSGMQVLNTVFGGESKSGGSNHSSLEGQSSYHHIYIAPGSRLATIVGSGGFVRVNSRHDRVVTEIGKSERLLASAYSLHDGVIEALESPKHTWVLGVQFHPEMSMEIPPHFHRLFVSLIGVAKSRKLGLESQ